MHKPEYDNKDLNRNMAAAIAAAHNTIAHVFGIHVCMVRCKQDCIPCMTAALPEYGKHLLQIPRKHFRFQKPTTRERCEMYAGNPRWGVYIIIAGNAKGFQTHLPYWDSCYMSRLLQTLQEAINQSLPDDKEIQDTSVYYKPHSNNAPQQPTSLTRKQLSKMG